MPFAVKEIEITQTDDEAVGSHKLVRREAVIDASRKTSATIEVLTDRLSKEGAIEFEKVAADRE